MARRPHDQRVADSKATLAAGGDAWLATTDGDAPHMIPLSLAWDADQGDCIFCTPEGSITVRNIRSGSDRVRVAIGGTRNVVLIRGVARVVGHGAEAPDAAAVFARCTGWDASDDEEYVFLRVRPVTCDTWREVDEIEGRRVMRDGRWIDAAGQSDA